MKGSVGKYCQLVSVFLLTVAIASTFALIDIDPHHQGIMFKPALDVAHGQMLFRDTFTQYGALTTLLQAWALRMFGDYLAVIQLQTAFVYGLISLCLWYLWARILPNWLTTVSVFIWLSVAPYFDLTFFPWSSVYALFFQLLSLLLLFRALELRNRLVIFFSGMVTVLAFWCRQPVGVFHCFSMIFFLATAPLITRQPWKNSLTDCMAFVAGIVMSSLPFLLWLYLNNAVHDMYLQSFKLAFFFGVRDSYSSKELFEHILRSLFPILQDQPDYSNIMWSLPPAVCWSLCAILGIKFLRKTDYDKLYLPLYGLTVVSLASWLQYYPASDLRHWYWAATPMFGLVSFCAWHALRNKKIQSRVIITCVVLAAVFGMETARRIFSGYEKIRLAEKMSKELPMVMRGMLVPPDTAARYTSMSNVLDSIVRKDPSHTLLYIGTDALYPTFSRQRKNIHPMYVDWGAYNEFIYPNYLRERDAYIDVTKPVVLADENMFPPKTGYIKIMEWTDDANKKLNLYVYSGSNTLHK